MSFINGKKVLTICNTTYVGDNINLDATPKGVYDNLAALQTAYPTGSDGVYLTSDNGHWYFYQNGWQDGGVYQAVDIADGSITIKKTNFISVFTGKNIFNASDSNMYIGTSSTVGECWVINSSNGDVIRNQFQMDAPYSVSYLIPVKPNTTYYFSQNGEARNIYQTAFYDSNSNFISMANNYSTQITTPNNCYFIRINHPNISEGNKYQIEENAVSSYEEYYEYYIIDNLKIDEENILNKTIEKKLATPFIFNSIGVIGDSYSIGQTYNTDGTWKTNNDRYSWFKQIAYKYNIVATSYAIGGINTRTWLANTDLGLSKLLSDNASDCYFLALGINDAYGLGINYLGTINDIKEDYTQNEYTFYRNYGNIISNILINKPDSKIMMFTIANSGDIYDTFNAAIIEIANHFNIPYAVTREDYFFTSECFTTQIAGHPTCVGYSGMGDAYDRVISKCISNNINYFKTLNID
jgi:hypothetical protein